LTWGGRSLLPCDPATPPTPRLADVLRRMISAMDKDVGKNVIRLASSRGPRQELEPMATSRG